ncbi:hypothetical protein D3C72_1472450 [compost metagenome]
MEIPDRLLRLRKMIGQEAAAVLLREEAVEAPLAVRLRANVEQIHHEEVARLCAFHAHRAGQEVDDGEVDVTHIVGRVVVLDETAGPVVGLQDEVLAGLDPAGHRDIRMPAVVDVGVLVRRFGQIDLDQGIRHDVCLLVAVKMW